MKVYRASLGDVSAVFPGGIYVPEDVRDAKDVGFEHSESLGAIASPYLYELDYLPARFPVPVVTVGGNPRTVVSYDAQAAPGIGQVAVCFDYPLIQFYSGDVGLAAELDYTALGTVPTARFYNQLGKEMAAIEEVYGDVNSAVDALDTRLTTAESDIATAEGEIDTLQSDTTALDSRLTTAEGEIDALQANVPLLDAASNTFEGDIIAAAFIGDGSGLTNLPGGGGSIDPSSVYSVTSDAEMATAISDVNTAGGSVDKLILVYPGTYTGRYQLTTEKTHIRGVSRTATRFISDDEVPCIWIRASHCSVSNIYGGNTKAIDADSGIVIKAGEHPINEPSVPTITDIWVYDCTLHAVDRDALYIRQSVDVAHVRNCDITANLDTVACESKTAYIDGCRITIAAPSDNAPLWLGRAKSTHDEVNYFVTNCVLVGGEYALNIAEAGTTEPNLTVYLDGVACHDVQKLYIAPDAGYFESVFINLGWVSGIAQPTTGDIVGGGVVGVGDWGTPVSRNLNASYLTGTIADARLSSNVVTLTGSQTLTNKSIAASQLTGTVDNARLADSVCKTIFANTAISTELNNHTAATAFDVDYTFPANAFVAGATYEVYAAGVFSCAVAATFTASLVVAGDQVYFNSISAAAGWANEGWSARAVFTISASGGSGTFFSSAEGLIRINSLRTLAYSGLSVDTTTTNDVLPRATWSVADAGNKATLTHLIIKRVA